jgi:hypothetical protein
VVDRGAAVLYAATGSPRTAKGGHRRRHGHGPARRRTLSVTLALRMNCCETLPSSSPCRNSCRSTKCCHAMLCNGRARLACRMPFRKAHALHRSPDRSCPTQRPALPPQAICPNCRATLQGLVGCYQRPTTSIVRWSTRLWSVAIGAFCCARARWLDRSIGARIRAAVVVRGIVNSVRAGARRRGDEPGFCALNAGVRVIRSVVNSVHTEPRRNSEKGNSFLGELRPRADRRCQQRTPSATRPFPMPFRTSPRLRVPARTLFGGVASTAAAASVHTDHKR